MLSDDLGGLVTLDVLCACVPARHAAVAIEHEDRIVGDALDQQAEIRFTLARLALALRTATDRFSLPACSGHAVPRPNLSERGSSPEVPEAWRIGIFEQNQGSSWAFVFDDSRKGRFGGGTPVAICAWDGIAGRHVSSVAVRWWARRDAPLPTLRALSLVIARSN